MLSKGRMDMAPTSWTSQILFERKTGYHNHCYKTGPNTLTRQEFGVVSGDLFSVYPPEDPAADVGVGGVGCGVWGGPIHLDVNISEVAPSGPTISFQSHRHVNTAADSAHRPAIPAGKPPQGSDRKNV